MPLRRKRSTAFCMRLKRIGVDAESAPAPVPAHVPDERAASVATTPVLDENEGSDAVLDDHTGNANPEQKSEKEEEMAVPIEQRIDKLPKDATPALHEDILSSMAGDVEALKAVTETVIKDHTRRHRSRTAQRAFLAWLEEHDSPQQTITTPSINNGEKEKKYYEQI